jgi:hypothetical protein
MKKSTTDEKQLKQTILELAREMGKDKETMTRADLAYELRQDTLPSDSVEVSRLVYETYQEAGNDKAVFNTYVSNDGRKSLVEEYRLQALLVEDKKEDAMSLAMRQLEDTKEALSAVQAGIDANLSATLVKAASGAMDLITGTGGVKAVKQEASTLFRKYADMVSVYHEGEDRVRSNIADFTALRDDIQATYQEYARQLIDIYGDSVKAVAPRLFDFSRVEFLDVDGMLKHTELEYNKITDKCGTLISEISDSFRSTVQGSLSAYKSMGQGNKTLGLAMAGLTMLDHYARSQERTNRLRSDLEVFKTSVKRDATTIKADLGRLLVIYKTLNDVALPKADIYLRHANQLMRSDISSILDALYASPGVKALQEKRQQLSRELKAIDGEINDHLQNIDIYQSLITDLTATLEAKGPSYHEARSKEPGKPSFIVNLFTFGTARKNYYRNYTEWDEVCRPLIKEYESNQVDLKLDKDELARHRQDLTDRQADRERVAKELESLNQQIRENIHASKDLQLRMLPHLRTVVAMLRLGREIMETKLDERLTRAVNIPDMTEATRLPADVEDNLSLFTNMLADNLHVGQQEAKALLDGIDEYRETSDEERTYTEEELNQVAEAAGQTLGKAMELLDSFVRLKTQRLNGKLAAAAYDKEYQRLASGFRRQIEKIDDKSAFLRQIMTRVNTARSEEERRQAFMSLAELSGISVSDQELDDFINGDKQIEL